MCDGVDMHHDHHFPRHKQQWQLSHLIQFLLEECAQEMAGQQELLVGERVSVVVTAAILSEAVQFAHHVQKTFKLGRHIVGVNQDESGEEQSTNFSVRHRGTLSQGATKARAQELQAVACNIARKRANGSVVTYTISREENVLRGDKSESSSSDFQSSKDSIETTFGVCAVPTGAVCPGGPRMSP